MLANVNQLKVYCNAVGDPTVRCVRVRRYPSWDGKPRDKFECFMGLITPDEEWERWDGETDGNGVEGLIEELIDNNVVEAAYSQGDILTIVGSYSAELS